MKEINVRTVAIKMGVSTQAVYKWLEGRDPTPANLSLALQEAADRLLKSARINEERAVEYQVMAQSIEAQEASES